MDKLPTRLGALRRPAPARAIRIRLPPGPPARYSRCVARTPSIRASDLDRERVVERLRHATAEGRLRTEELEERLEATYAARTYGELDVLVADLPAQRPPTPPERRKTHVPAWAGLAGVLALFTLLSVGAATGVHREAVAARLANGQPEAFGLPGPRYVPPPAYAEHLHAGLVTAASVAGLLAVAAAAFAFAWLVTRTRSRTRL